MFTSHQRIINISQKKIYDTFFTEYENFTHKFIYVIITGNLNARCGSLDDITYVDETIFDVIDIDSNIVFEYDLTNVLKRLNFSIKRSSMGHTVNKVGRDIIDFCKRNDSVILNGRAFSDKNIGNFTCQEISVVDYTIASIQCLKLFMSFKVDEYSSLLSGVHCPITFSLAALESQIIKKNTLNDGIMKKQMNLN